ncbi:uncharacterized protein LOC129265391 isoform X1 [Lytechinus pictus]|uniref:uncharacterized protein LOC129265391 isoform X1 n=1 Tax=Lytechinus pictus TaxID=7653 RepID=UPI0030B9F9B4
MADLMLTSLHIYLPVLLMLCTLATCKCEVDEQNINGWLGQDNVRLPCNFHQDVIVAQLLHQDVISALYWSKMRDPTKAEEEDSTKASYFKKQLNSLEDRFTLNEDFSLSISDLQVADEGRYLCQVEFESDKSLLMYQTLTVYEQGMFPSQYIIIFSVLGFFILIALVAIITVLCRGATTRTIKELRKSIRDYTFKIPDSDDKATAKIGLYGEMGAGKSTFINSIEFAYNGQRSQPTRRRRYAGGGHSMIRSCLPLTDYISLFDNRGMSDFSHSYVDKYMKEISDEKEAGTQTRLLDEEIQCVVFVYRHSGDNTKQDAKRFLDKFATELRRYFGYSAFVVVTHADSLSKEAKADLKETFSPICDKLWFLENYTDDIEDKEKSIRFLKFLKAALHRCDVAIVNIERRKTQRKKKWFWQRWLGW